MHSSRFPFHRKREPIVAVQILVFLSLLLILLAVFPKLQQLPVAELQVCQLLSLQPP